MSNEENGITKIENKTNRKQQKETVVYGYHLNAQLINNNGFSIIYNLVREFSQFA